MRYIRHNYKGFTLVELVLVLGIMGIVLTAVSSFLITNVTHFHRSDDQIETQYNAQVAMNEIIDNIIDAEKIESINFKDSVVYSGSPITVIEIVFKINNSKYFQVVYNTTNNSLRRGFGTSPTTITTNQFANNISDFKIGLIDTLNYPESKGIEIEMTSKVKEETTVLKNQVYFRNSE